MSKLNITDNMEKKPPLVSIIIINRNGVPHLRKLIPALLKYTDSSLYEIILVDNASTDYSIKFFQNTLLDDDSPPVLKVIKNKKNESFSRANNQAVELAESHYLLLLNNDIEPCAGWLDALLDCAKSIKNIGSAGAKLIYPSFEGSSVGSFWGRAKKQKQLAQTIQHAGIAFNNEAFQFRPYNLGKGHAIDSVTVNSSQKRVALTAACLLIPKDRYLEVGGLDEAFNYGGEDVDLGLKLHKAGYINYYCAESVLYHHEFGTQSKEQQKAGALRRSNNLRIFQERWFLTIKKAYWSEKIYGETPFYAEQPLTIAVLDPSVIDKAALKTMQEYGWKIINISPKQLKKYQQNNQYDFLLTAKENEELELHSNELNILFSSKSWVESFQQYLVQRYLTPSFVLKIAAKRWKGIHTWGDYHMAVSLKKYLQRLGHHVLIQIHPEWGNLEGLSYDVALVFRGLRAYQTNPQQINMMWNISHPDEVSIKEYDSYDQVFIASSYWASRISKKANVNIEPMLQCTDTEIFIEPSKEDKKKAKHSLLFVGNSRKVYRKIIKDLFINGNIDDKYDLSVYGKEWDKFIPKRFIKATHIENKGLYQYYGNCDVLLNDHWDDMREKGFISNRIFDALACGAIIVSDKVNKAGKLRNFINVYEFPESLEHTIESILSDKKIFIQKAQKGMLYVQQEHTFKERAEVFSEISKRLVNTQIG